MEEQNQHSFEEQQYNEYLFLSFDAMKQSVPMGEIPRRANKFALKMMKKRQKNLQKLGILKPDPTEQ